MDESTQLAEETTQTSEPTQVDDPAQVDEALGESAQTDESTQLDAPAQTDTSTQTDEEVIATEGEATEDEIEDEDSRPSWRFGFQRPTREQLLTSIAFWSVILLGAVLRFWGLGDKPLHHDESLHAYFSMGLLHNTIENWASCFSAENSACYRYDPLLHGPFQFHGIAIVYKISQWLGAPDNGLNNTTVRILAATLGSALVALPCLVRKYLGTVGAWVACFLLAISPSMVYYSRFAREDIYMAFFTLLLVVCLVRYVQSRHMGWLIGAAAAFALSYATKEATFLTVGVFGSFFGAVLAWELGVRLPIRERVDEDVALRNWLPRTAAPIFVLLYFGICGILAKWFFGKLKDLSDYVTDEKTKPLADAFVAQLKNNTVFVIPFIGIALGIFVIYKLVRELMNERSHEDGRRSIASFIDRRKQPWLNTLLAMPWIHWVFALICGWSIFLVLFTALFTMIKTGVGDGIWQGLYYWLAQQHEARGGQPWYYYLLLIPLYEQIGVVFGLVGIVRCLLRPTRFRLFLVYWFIGNFFIYSWAAEKMPWLTIHMVIPMLLLAAIGLEPAAQALVNFGKWLASEAARRKAAAEAAETLPRQPMLRPGQVGVGLTMLLALLLLAPTLQNMYQLTYVHPADAGHEMMIYVQTSVDIDTVMAKIDALDQKLYHGQHKLGIGVMSEATWPFAWYLRDYPNTCFNYPASQPSCPAAAQHPEVIIPAGEQIYTAQQQFGQEYNYQQYRMRVQWDQGYMPPQCQPTTSNPCTDPQPYIGVGPFLWLAYGDNPPSWAYTKSCTTGDISCVGANIGRIALGTSSAITRIWQWWWQRIPFGDPNGSFDMDLMIRKGLPVAP
ncbi:MAG: TIGR03663 family protein [Ktedonobacteraceae bacterium]|nr:TIGR03663 family protein [Ktedonobacteraceae bacterium]MBO0792013.1 TIGR03663 family protein [Ktedonobacteraceae bacterium]